MKFTYVLSLIALPLGALASSPADHAPPSLVQRDLPAISAAAASVSSSIKALDKAVKEFTTDAAPVNAAAKKLAESVTSGIAAIIKQTSALSLPDALSLQPIVESLSKDWQSLVKNLEGKKGALQKAGACDALSSVVTGLVNSSDQLIKAILAQVPEAWRSIAKQLTDGLLESIKEGQKGFTQCSGGQPSSTSKSAGTLPASQVGSQTTTSTQKSSTTTTRAPLASTTSACHCPCLATSSSRPPPSSPPPSSQPPSSQPPSSTKTSSTTTPPKTTTTSSRVSSSLTLIPPTTRPPTQNTTQPPAQNVTSRPPTSTIITAGGSGVFSTGGQSLGLGVFLAAVAALAL